MSVSRSEWDLSPQQHIWWKLCLLECGSVYNSGGATTIPALRWEREAFSDQSNTDASYLTHQLCGYTTPHPCLLPLEENGWMLAGDEYVPVPCLYKPAPVAVLELIKCGCKTFCKCHYSCKKNNLPCTALCKCHNSDCSHLPNYGMIADEDDV